MLKQTRKVLKHTCLYLYLTMLYEMGWALLSVQPLYGNEQPALSTEGTSFRIVPATAGASNLVPELSLSLVEQQWVALHKRLNVGMLWSPEPLMKLDKGALRGLLVDYLVAAQTSLGISQLNVRLYPDVQALLQAVAQNKLHMVLISTNHQPLVKHKKLLMTMPVINSYPVLVAPRFNRDLRGLADLNHKTLALSHDFPALTSIEQQFPLVQIQLAPNVKAALELVKQSQADAFVGELIRTTYQFETLGLEDFNVLGPVEVTAGQYVFAVRQDLSMLHFLLTQWLQRLTTEHHQRFLKPWVSPTVALALDSPPLNLTDQEKAWLKARPVIKVGVDRSWKPLDFINKNNQHVGISAEYLRRLEKQIGVQFEVVGSDSWRRLLQGIQYGEVDMLSAVMLTEQRKRNMLFSQAYLQMPWAIATRVDAPFISDIADLTGQTVAVVADYAIQEKLQRQYPLVNLIITESLEESLALLLDGEAHAIVGNQAMLTDYIQQEYLGRLKLAALLKEDPASIHFAIRMDWPELEGIINKALSSMSQQQHLQIREKWLADRYQTQAILPLWTIWLVLIIIVAAICGYLFYRVRQLQRRRDDIWQRLEFSQQLREQLLESLPLPVALINKQGHCLHMNYAWRQLLEGEGDDKEALLSQEGYSSSHEEPAQLAFLPSLPDLQPWPNVRGLIGHLAECEKTCFELQGVSEKGLPWRWQVSLHGCFVSGELEEALLAIEVFDKQEQARQRYREAESLLTQVTEHCPVVLFQCQIDQEGQWTFSFISNNVSRAYGVNRLAVLEDSTLLLQHVIEEDREALKYSFEIAGQRMSRWHHCFRLQLSDGQVRWIEGQALPRNDQNKQLIWVGYWSDITARYLAEQTLKESEARYRSLVDNLSCVVYRCKLDTHWTMEFISDNIKALTGYSAKGLLGNAQQSFKEIIFEQDREKVDHTVWRAVAVRKPYEIEYRLKTTRGEPCWVYEQGQAFFSDAGDALHLDGVIVDIDQRKKQELALFAAKQAAEEATQQQLEVLAMLTREIACPTDRLSGLAEMLQQTHLNARQRYITERLLSTIHALQKNVNDMQDFAALETEQVEIQCKPVRLIPVLETLIVETYEACQQKGLQFKSYIDQGIAFELWGDQQHLAQILRNLLGNAVKYTSQGHVSFSVKRLWANEKQQQIGFSIKDTGPGIPDTLQQALTRPYFYSPQNDQESTSGIGLGLAVSGKLAQQMQGELCVKNYEPTGCHAAYSQRFDIKQPSLLPVFSGQAVAALLCHERWFSHILLDYCHCWGLHPIQPALVVNKAEQLADFLSLQQASLLIASRETIDLLIGLTPYELHTVCQLLKVSLIVLDGHEEPPSPVADAHHKADAPLIFVKTKPFLSSELLEACEQALGVKPPAQLTQEALPTRLDLAKVTTMLVNPMALTRLFGTGQRLQLELFEFQELGELCMLALEQAIKAGDMVQIKKMGGKFKAAANVISAGPLAEACQALVEAAEHDSKEMEGIWDDLQQVWLRTQKAMKRLLEQPAFPQQAGS
ncbi:transporter substrate-binding domain-containing protein [Zooshikella marina]|uniref:transporter substrate-binding domain-containing protein n=1 Tax=Zooshikella ganghwensis TaxID=202772 RepID=UPI001BB05494|nr:transporter substrate-binding domain-containing protein [Zooshikella ganghwensis]MBU2704514.1 transporter substrate-binding domain-containing protein [Zooshikella ganghwensis]